MVLLLLVALPAVLGLVALAVPGATPRRALLVGGALLQAALVGMVLRDGAPAALGGWLALDAPGTASARSPRTAGSRTRESSTMSDVA